MKHMVALSRQNVELFSVKAGGTYNDHSAVMGLISPRSVSYATCNSVFFQKLMLGLNLNASLIHASLLTVPSLNVRKLLSVCH
jgi:hypothetical protein